MLRRVKDAVFDIIYTVLWIRPWAAVAIFLIGLLCFWVCFMQHSLAEEFCSIEENESVAVAEGTVTDWDYHRGGSKSGTERLRVTLDDGIEYFMINDVLDLCKQRGLTERIENGYLVEIHSFDSDGDYYPRIFAISVNGEFFFDERGRYCNLLYGRQNDFRYSSGSIYFGMCLCDISYNYIFYPKVCDEIKM